MTISDDDGLDDEDTFEYDADKSGEIDPHPEFLRIGLEIGYNYVSLSRYNKTIQIFKSGLSLEEDADIIVYVGGVSIEVCWYRDDQFFFPGTAPDRQTFDLETEEQTGWHNVRKCLRKMGVPLKVEADH